MQTSTNTIESNISPNLYRFRSIPEGLLGLLDSGESIKNPHFFKSEKDLNRCDDVCSIGRKKTVPIVGESSRILPEIPMDVSEVLPSDVACGSNSTGATGTEIANDVCLVTPKLCVESDSQLPLTKRGAIRKRGLKGDTRNSRILRKEHRNIGKSYCTKKGQLIPARETKPLGPCRNKCSNKISDSYRESLFQEYWAMGNFNRRLDYISKLINIKTPKRTRIKLTGNSCKQITVEYYLEINGNLTNICKSCFLNIFGESRRFLETVIQKKRASHTGIVDPDNRGSHRKNEKNKSVRTKVQEFLQKVHFYRSHYSWIDCNQKSPHLTTITSLHQEYLKVSEGNQTASYRVFCEEYHNLKLCIKNPETDTCATCDKLAMKEKIASESDKSGIKDKLNEHQHFLLAENLPQTITDDSKEVLPGVACESNSEGATGAEVTNAAYLVIPELGVESNSQLPLTKKGTIRKRGFKGDTRKSRILRKEHRNIGKSYCTKKGLFIPARETKPIGPCRNKCSEKISDSQRESLFQDYWGMGDFNRRLDYISRLINIKTPKRTRIRSTGDSFKQITVEYCLEINGTMTNVCKSCFLNIFGESRRFLETIIQKKRASRTGFIDPDNRGSHRKHENADAVRTKVKEFLQKVPFYESHDSRADCSTKSSNPTITFLHQEYLKISEGSQTASYRVFSEEYHNLNICIKTSEVDTCDKLTMEEK